MTDRIFSGTSFFRSKKSYRCQFGYGLALTRGSAKRKHNLQVLLSKEINALFLSTIIPVKDKSTILSLKCYILKTLSEMLERIDKSLSQPDLIQFFVLL